MSAYRSSDDQGSSQDDGHLSAKKNHSQGGRSERPGYMTVGSGSTSQNAARLTSMIDNDSGYGGSLHDGETSFSGSRHGLADFSQTLTDVPIPSGSSSLHCKYQHGTKGIFAE